MRHAIGLTLAAGLLTLLPATAAQAQFSYGRDSFIYGGYTPSMSYYNASGYDRIYTSPVNGIYADGTGLPPQGITPYNAPPFGSFTPGNGLPTVYAQQGRVVAGRAVNPAPAVVTPTVKVRRPARRLFRR